MVNLLHEIWEEELDDRAMSHELCVVSAESDEQRRRLSPNSRLVHSFYASSYNNAMQCFYDWGDYGTYKPFPDEPDRVYSASDLAKQQSYLQTRTS